jgi:ribose transport system substrate-binding protein
MRQRGRVRSASVVLAALLLVSAACGDDDEDGGGSAATTEGTEASDDTSATTTGGDAEDDPVASAQAIVDEYLAVPAGVGVSEPLSEVPPPDQRIAWVGCPTGTCVAEGEALTEAAAEFGWTVERTEYALTPEGIQTAFNAALDTQPDALMSSATPTELMTDIRARAAEEGIPFFECCNLVPDDISDPPVSVIMDQDLVAFYAFLIVQWQIVETDGNVHNLTVTAPDFPILDAGRQSYDDALAEACPDDCTTETLNVSVTDIGTRLPGQVVSELQRNPDINYVTIIGSGPFATGIAAAMREAGLSDQAAIVGTAPDSVNFENMQNGDEEMWIGFSEQIVGWRLVDLFARHLTGEDLPLRATGPEDDGPAAWLPIQYITADTWPTTDPWAVPEDYRDVFRQLWGV